MQSGGEASCADLDSLGWLSQVLEHEPRLKPSLALAFQLVAQASLYMWSCLGLRTFRLRRNTPLLPSPTRSASAPLHFAALTMVRVNARNQ